MFCNLSRVTTVNRVRPPAPEIYHKPLYLKDFSKFCLTITIESKLGPVMIWLRRHNAAFPYKYTQKKTALTGGVAARRFHARNHDLFDYWYEGNPMTLPLGRAAAYDIAMNQMRRVPRAKDGTVETRISENANGLTSERSLFQVPVAPAVRGGHCGWRQCTASSHPSR